MTSIESWTDVDYALAAIDMLPDTVEEIVEFLRVHGIRGTSHSAEQCPIALWVQRWTGNDYPGGEWVTCNRVVVGRSDEIDVPTPVSVHDFVVEYDGGKITL